VTATGPRGAGHRGAHAVADAGEPHRDHRDLLIAAIETILDRAEALLDREAFDGDDAAAAEVDAWLPWPELAAAVARSPDGTVRRVHARLDDLVRPWRPGGAVRDEHADDDDARDLDDVPALGPLLRSSRAIAPAVRPSAVRPMPPGHSRDS